MTMMTSHSLARLASFALVLSFFFITGCDSTQPPSASSNNELKQLGSQFMDFFRAQGKTPTDEKEFKEFITANMTDVKRKLLGITDVEKLFVSPRDGKPFVIRYGMKMSSGIPTSGAGTVINGDVIAYESVGAGGFRHVTSSLNDLVDLSLEDLKKLVPDAK
jgi:hypothetical protein